MILAQSLVEETLARLLRWQEQLLRWRDRSTFADTSAGHGLQICEAKICTRQTNFGHLFINSEVRVPKSNWPLQMSCHGVEIQVFNQLYLESFKKLPSDPEQVCLSDTDVPSKTVLRNLMVADSDFVTNTSSEIIFVIWNSQNGCEPKLFSLWRIGR